MNAINPIPPASYSERLAVHRLLTCCSFVVLLLSATIARAGTFNSILSVGDQAPAWSGLVGTDDAQHALADLQEAKAVVVVFTCNHCPVAIANEDRLIALERDYHQRGVRVVAINVNNLPEDTLEPMKQRAAEKQFNFSYLYDPTQKSARAYGATVTPHVFLLDAERRIAYMGAIDDNALEPDQVTKHYLRNAIDAVLAGTKPPVAETRQKGCGIKYESR